MTTYICKRDNIEFYEIEDLCGCCSDGEAKEDGIVCKGEYREVIR
jgi:hypothetical protein